MRGPGSEPDRETARHTGNTLGRRRGRRRQRGAALVEFALVVVLLLPLLLAIIEFGRAWFTVQVIQSAAREGARVCAMSIGTPELRRERATNRIRDLLAEAGVDDYEVEFQSTWSFGRPITVVVRHPFESIAGPFIPALGSAIELQGTAVFNQEFP